LLCIFFKSIILKVVYKNYASIKQERRNQNQAREAEKKSKLKLISLTIIFYLLKYELINVNCFRIDILFYGFLIENEYLKTDQFTLRSITKNLNLFSLLF